MLKNYVFEISHTFEIHDRSSNLHENCNEL